jgi:predicted acetyltransferase
MGGIQFEELPRSEWYAARTLTSYCFGDTGAFVDWVFDRRADHVYALVESDTLLAQVIDTRVRLRARDKAVEGRIISHVATDPARRGQGLMASLLPNAMSREQEEGAALAALYPFEYAYYEKYGWAACGEAARLTLPLGILRSREPSIPVRWSPVRNADASGLAICYNEAYADVAGSVVRTAELTAARLKELELDSAAAVWVMPDDAERMRGYMLYRFEGRAIVVEEFAAVDIAARRTLLSYLAAHSSTHDEVRLTVSADDPVRRLVPDRRGCVSLEPWAMFRILDVPRLAEGMRASEGYDGSISLCVVDNELPWNNGCWRFSAVDGLLHAERAYAKDAPEISINTLTRLILGGPDEAWALPPAAAEEAAMLFPQQKIWMSEQY